MEDDVAFERAVTLYRTKVFRLVFSIIRNDARAEEVTQDVFLKVWLALPTYDGRASLSTWIYTIARNTALSHRRAESYRTCSAIDHAAEPRAAVASPLERMEVEQLVGRLPDEQREVIELFYLQERSIEDVGAMLDMPEGTVKSHLHRARRALAAMMRMRV
jgi:RNA polymerase sigma-70 factor (ECF subfamily)